MVNLILQIVDDAYLELAKLISLRALNCRGLSLASSFQNHNRIGSRAAAGGECLGKSVRNTRCGILRIGMCENQKHRAELHMSIYLQLDCSSRSSIRTRNINLPTIRATANPRPRTESSRQGESRSQELFLCDPFLPLFQNNFPNNVKKKRRTKFSSLNSLVPRSRVLLRCLSLLANWVLIFLRKSSWYACAR